VARKEPQNRPTAAQLAKSRERIEGYLVQLGHPLRQVAAEFNSTRRHTEKQLRQYLFTEPEKVLRYYSRNRAYRDFFQGSTNVEPKEFTVQLPPRTIRGKIVPQSRVETRKVRVLSGPIKGIEPYAPESGTEEQERLYRQFTASSRQGFELPSLQMSLNWQNYTSRYDIPVSIEDIKDLYAEGEISKRQVGNILTHWHSIYSNMSDDWYDDMVDQFAEYDDAF
jgi:hypothetical protein